MANKEVVAKAKSKYDAKTSSLIDQQTWKMWGYCRDNANSLDSASACAFLRLSLEACIDETKKLLADSCDNAKELDKSRLEWKRLCRDHELVIAELKKEATELRDVIREVTR